MMEDFHDSAHRADEALDATASAEAESRATPQAPTRVGADTSGSVTPQAATGGGLSHRAQVLP
jgi:hypothetical protein